MTDIALRFDAQSWSGDLALENGAIATDDGLRTAIVISLFTDARAREADLIADGEDPRGWWGDALNDDPADRTGSRLWQLGRAKATQTTAVRAREIAAEALAWLIEDGVASSVDVETVVVAPTPRHPRGAIGIGVTVTRPRGPGRQRFDFVWDATAENFA